MNNIIKTCRCLACGVVMMMAAVGGAVADVVREVEYKPGNGAFGRGDVYRPAEWNDQTPVALLIHGGGWDSMDRSAVVGIAIWLRDELGMAVFNIDYRLCGAKGAPWPACGDDCVAAARFALSDAFAAKCGLKPCRLWVIGGSAGGHLALWTGLTLPREQIAGIVSISGIGVLAPDYAVRPGRYRTLFGRADITPELLRSAEPAALLKADSPPIFNSHAVIDGAAPFACTEAFVAACRAKGVRHEFYSYEKRDEGHSIWIPGSNPHRLFPDIERRIGKFIKDVR